MNERSIFSWPKVDDVEDFNEELIDFRAINGAKMKFSSLSLSCFWDSQLQTYSTVAVITLKEVLSWYESGFSRWVKIISKYRNRIDVRPDIRLSLSKVKPRISVLVGECCQGQKTHRTSDVQETSVQMLKWIKNLCILFIRSPSVALFVVYSIRLGGPQKLNEWLRGPRDEKVWETLIWEISKAVRSSKS